MELYDLRHKTLELVELLRTKGTIGVHNGERNNGKSTALLIFAKELLDKSPITQSVMVIHFDPKSAERQFKQLFPHAVNKPAFFRVPPHPAAAKNAHVLIDEPSVVGHEKEIEDLSRFGATRVYSVGRWF